MSDPWAEHDPLCPFSYMPSVSCPRCELIRVARADEREQAAQRVKESLDNTHRTPTCHCKCDECLVHDGAVVAARGEDTTK